MTLPRERQLLTRLDRISNDVREHTIGSPAIMVIGEVARDRRDCTLEPSPHHFLRDHVRAEATLYP